ncbi:hypothetical protein PHISCL_03052 [Aspergillus sclerotialis]|uniref:Uncharacterized protein n=1 Tax=Aspergillus sclerotialis TaxID=2070753 RepID=A0A3A2ZN11_9EURO|nr:hypothetical protein PHISCL_03052 [Aspergillus sclerotialis]
MVLAGSEDHGVAQRCAIAGELLDSLSTIPTIYIQATSTAMLHHLAGVGHLLASVIHSPLSQWMYLQVRSALLAITGLVRSLETALNSAIDISSKLRGHVQRIDQYMTHALKKEEGHVLHSALPADLLDGPSQRDSHWINQGATDELNRESSFPSSTSPMIPGLEPHTLLDIQSLSDDPSTSTVAADLLPQLQFNDEGFPNWSFDLSHGNAFDFLGRAHGDETSDSVGWHGVDN